MNIMLYTVHTKFEKTKRNKKNRKGKVYMSIFSENIDDRSSSVASLLNLDRNSDIVQRNIIVGGRRAVFFTVDGLLDSDLSEEVLEYLRTIDKNDMPEDLQGLLDKCIPYADAKSVSDEEGFISSVLSGVSCIIIDGYKDIMTMDLRKFPARTVAEPNKDKVLRGSRDGFIESILPNIALIRRRIRDVNLIFEMQKAGKASRTDIAVAYIKGRVNDSVVRKVIDKINSIEVDSLTLNQESLAEVLCPGHWFNPFPKFKYTERPDSAAACLLEGSVVILVDNSPSVMIIPTSLFDIIEDANDYYFPPITGTYLRLTRMATNLIAIFITPIFLLLIENPEWVPKSLEFILIEDEINVNPLIQFLILELAVDGLKMASVNTPSMLSTPLSVVAAIVFGDYTVQSGWFNSEIMLYMAFVAVANYTQSNMELGYALKFSRIMLLILTEFFGVWGFVSGVIIIALSLLFNKTFAGKGYLYPLIPFNAIQLMKRFFRVGITPSEKLNNSAGK